MMHNLPSTAMDALSKALGITFMLFVAVVALMALRHVTVGIYRDIRAAWNASRKPKSWQPRPRPFIAHRK